MKVPFGKINFLFGSVSFPIFIEEIVFEISNSDIRPEFAAIRDYFAKALKKKLVAVTIIVKYTDSQIISATAKSDDIDSINSHMIDSVRFEFVKLEIFKGKGRTIDDKTILKMEDLLSSYGEGKKLFSAEAALIDDILNIKNFQALFTAKISFIKARGNCFETEICPTTILLFILTGRRKEISYYMGNIG